MSDLQHLQRAGAGTACLTETEIAGKIMADAIQQSLTEAILESVRERLKEIVPVEGWPSFGEIHFIIFLHDGSIAKSKGQLISQVVEVKKS